MMAPKTYAEIPSTIATLQTKVLACTINRMRMTCITFIFQQLRQYEQLTTSQLPKEPSEVDSQITDDDISHTTDEMLLDDTMNEPMQGDTADSGTSSPTSKPNLIDTNS